MISAAAVSTFSTLLLVTLVVLFRPSVAATAVVEQKATCFASSLCCSRRRSTELGSVHNHNDRRSVLRDISALIAVAPSSAGAEAKSPQLRNKAAPRQPVASSTMMNFPRAHPGLRIGDMSSGVLCEVFVDFTCPYSRKLFTTISRLSYADRMALVYHNVIQPWHHQSLWLHESSLAVRLLYPEAETSYWKALFAVAPDWYDKEIYGLTRGDFYGRIASFAADAIVAEGSTRGDNLDAGVVKGRILQYLIPPKQEGGNFPDEARPLLGSSPEDDENAIFPLTRQIVKFQRKRGVHVTPTVFFNGIEQPQISSSWTTDDWIEFLDRALG